MRYSHLDTLVGLDDSSLKTLAVAEAKELQKRILKIEEKYEKEQGCQLNLLNFAHGICLTRWTNGHNNTFISKKFKNLNLEKLLYANGVYDKPKEGDTHNVNGGVNNEYISFMLAFAFYGAYLTGYCSSERDLHFTRIDLAYKLFPGVMWNIENYDVFQSITGSINKENHDFNKISVFNAAKYGLYFGLPTEFIQAVIGLSNKAELRGAVVGQSALRYIISHGGVEYLHKIKPSDFMKIAIDFLEKGEHDGYACNLHDISDNSELLLLREKFEKQATFPFRLNLGRLSFFALETYMKLAELHPILRTSVYDNLRPTANVYPQLKENQQEAFPEAKTA